MCGSKHSDEENEYSFMARYKFHSSEFIKEMNRKHCVAKCFCAAKAGDAIEQRLLGDAYQYGDRVYLIKRDVCEAEEWYRKSAEQGNTDAMLGLARLAQREDDFWLQCWWLQNAVKFGSDCAERTLLKKQEIVKDALSGTLED